MKAGALAGGAVWVAPAISSFTSSAAAASGPAHRARSISNEPDSGIDYNGGSGHASFDFTDVFPFGSLSVGSGPGQYTVTIECVTFDGPGSVYVGGHVTGGAFIGNYFYGRMTNGGVGVGAIYGNFTTPECFPTNPGDVGGAFIITAGTISVTP
jgi:hypothetical protein